jgi:hypothetical protein
MLYWVPLLSILKVKIPTQDHMSAYINLDCITVRITRDTNWGDLIPLHALNNECGHTSQISAYANSC